MMLLKIKSLDTDGFNGRDNPPQPEHIGLVGVVVGCEVCYTAEDDFEFLDLPSKLVRRDPEAIEVVDKTIADQDCSGLITMWKVAVRGGEVLDVMDHEAELFSA